MCFCSPPLLKDGVLYGVCVLSCVLPVEGAVSQHSEVVWHLWLMGSSAANLGRLPAGPSCWTVALPSAAERYQKLSLDQEFSVSKNFVLTSYSLVPGLLHSLKEKSEFWILAAPQ